MTMSTQNVTTTTLCTTDLLIRPTQTTLTTPTTPSTNSDANTRNVCSFQNYPMHTTIHNDAQNLIYFILTLLTLF